MESPARNKGQTINIMDITACQSAGFALYRLGSHRARATRAAELVLETDGGRLFVVLALQRLEHLGSAPALYPARTRVPRVALCGTSRRLSNRPTGAL